MSIKRKDCMKPTDDDWCPNFSGNRVQLSLILNRKEKKLFRVCVWGNDDCGMERDFSSGNDTKDIEDAKLLYEMLAERPRINIADLEELGFVSA